MFKHHSHHHSNRDTILTTSQGVCHTDVLIGGLPNGAAPIAFYPRVLGHEGSGYVREVGAGVTVAKKGDPVLLSFAFCKSCAVCDAGHNSHCNSFNELNFGTQPNVFGAKDDSSNPTIPGAFFGQSSFATYAIGHARNVVKVPESAADIPLSTLAPLGCGLMTGAGAVLRSMQVRAGMPIILLSTVIIVALAAIKPF